TRNVHRWIRENWMVQHLYSIQPGLEILRLTDTETLHQLTSASPIFSIRGSDNHPNLVDQVRADKRLRKSAGIIASLVDRNTVSRCHRESRRRAGKVAFMSAWSCSN